MMIPGVQLVDHDAHRDQRGAFVETWRREWAPRFEPCQMNIVHRHCGSLVGLHYHRYQTDYWTVTAGAADVLLWDLRVGSPTEHAPMVLTLGGNPGGYPSQGLLIPPGVAHGFYAATDLTLCYLVDRYYDPADELGVAWNDPQFVDWDSTAVTGEPVLSERDRANPYLADIPAALLPQWRPQ